MTEIDAAFLEGQIIPLEEYLLSLELAELFTGRIYTSPNQPLTALALEGLGEETIELTPAEVGRLFMAPDESISRILRLQEQPDGTPAGVNVWSDNDFVQEGAPSWLLRTKTRMGQVCD